jgi:carboxypeptidase D
MWQLSRRHICGYDLNLTYPQIGHFPTLANPFTTLPDSVAEVYIARQQRRRTMFSALLLESSQDKAASVLTKRQLEQREERKRIWKRDLSGRTNGTLDPWYGCFLFDELFDYALNFTFPWSKWSL